VSVEVVTETEIARPRDEVAEFAANPDNATRWYANIESVKWETPPPLAVGSQLAFVARFLGRPLSYTYVVREHVPGERLVMASAEGPLPMETTYEWRDSLSGGTLMTLRNRGEPSGFQHVAAPLLARAMRHANIKDLRKLKEILET
jgi:Polyketide cyclase / dehydrase and lipid transport